MEEQSVKQCCAAFYGSDAARMLLGDSFHPGGIKLTERLGELLGLKRQSHVLDVAAGRGTSALHLAETFGCKVTGVDLSDENVRLAEAEATRRGLAGQISFQLADAERLPFDGGAFDAIVCECAFCTFPSKPIAAREFYRVLKTGGLLGLSDLTRNEVAIPGLDGLLSWIACIGDALPAVRYREILLEAGFQMRQQEDHSDALVEMVRQIQARLLGAEIMAGLKKIDLPGIDFATGREFSLAALDATRTGALGYVVLVAGKA
ncbi:MAG TPA: class I SAM-dependent methyltransferase [Terracidiphilus sp.]|nr:class I SAM-dependent methyltransferase [Terracidiphilus sp.]